MRAAALHLTACALVGASAAASAFAPDVVPSASRAAALRAPDAFPGWPDTFEGRPLVALAPTALDARFARDLPGRVRRFTDGEREIVLRWSAEPTRLVHPSAVCFRAQGWDVAPLPSVVDARGRTWSAFAATRHGERLAVRERVEDASGGSWPEPTAWWWASLLGRTSGPAWAWTVAARE